MGLDMYAFTVDAKDVGDAVTDVALGDNAVELFYWRNLTGLNVKLTIYNLLLVSFSVSKRYTPNNSKALQTSLPKQERHWIMARLCTTTHGGDRLWLL